jgi:hypothetical protein
VIRSFLSLPLLLLLLLVLGASTAAAQPGPSAPTNLRCPGPDLTYDPLTQQIVSAWEVVVSYPITNDDQGPMGKSWPRGANARQASHRARLHQAMGRPSSSVRRGSPSTGAATSMSPNL